MAENADDDLTMWRLYGDDAKGISIEYENPKSLPEDFLFAKVSYAESKEKHSKLDFIGELVNGKIGNRSFRLKQWGQWQHFFKPFEYAVEHEVRLLFFGNHFIYENVQEFEKKWIQTEQGITAPIAVFPCRQAKDKIQFPLKIKGITLGSRLPDKETNKLLIKVHLEETAITSGEKVDVHVSKIDNYR